MKQTKKSAPVVNNSSSSANVGNLAPVQIQDETTTKGKVTAKFNLNDLAAAEEQIEKVDKNQLFSVELNDYFCPVEFDSSTLEASLSPLVSSGILSEEAKAKAIETAKREFLAAHESEINAAQKLSFAEVVAKLKENETLYKKVLTACRVSELNESNYIKDGKVQIFRASQCQDKDGNNRYTECTLEAEENGVKFSVKLFVEYREITTANILLAIRYYSSKQEAQRKLKNKVNDYFQILQNVNTAICRAKENNFTISQIIEQVQNVYDCYFSYEIK